MPDVCFPHKQSHGEHQNLFYWLFGFVVFDYLSGIVAAARTGTWSSWVGLKGLIRKFIILMVAIGFHGVDQIFNEPWIGAWAIGALSLNELISILENVEKLGLVKLFPTESEKCWRPFRQEHEKRIKGKVHLGGNQNE
ncbi:MAG: phage holin family protein [Parasutterella sp.]